MEQKYIPLKRNWSAIDLFANIKPEDILVDNEFKQKYREFLLCDLRAESDSHNLYEELTQNYKYSMEFYDFLDSWYQDEKNHAAGFRKVISLLYGDDENELEQTMKNRKADFSELKSFFDDEFKLCVLFAYDEQASTMTYKKDTFYNLLGPTQFVKWITTVTGDEARHFGNVVKLIHYKHKERISETKAIIAEILKFENSGTNYKSTFLFDHDTEHFLLTSEELNQQCADRVYKKIMKVNKI